MTTPTKNLALPFGVTVPSVSSLSLSFNEHENYYLTIEDHFEERPSGRNDWISEEERAKAIAANTVWSAHLYPDTPIGFYRILGASLEAVIRALASAAP